jgi:hypothetical protein
MTTGQATKGFRDLTDAAYTYNERHIEAAAIAARITESLVNDKWPEGLDWGHVGDMAETVKGLRAVSDRMFGEGEHAPEAE